jgi:predicted dehydrogenase
MKLQVGVVGMGKMGLLHSAILNSIDDIELVAVADTEKMITGFLRKNLPHVTVYDNYQDMINDTGLNAVYITTPVGSHIPIASYCTDRNIHFFVEKPLARNVDECTPLLQTLKKANLVSMVGFCLRYVETFAKAKELLDKNYLGKVLDVSSTVYQSQAVSKGTGWRFKKEVSGGGVLIDLGSHLIDLLHWFFGDIVSLSGSVRSQGSFDIEDTALASIDFENGLKCSFEASRIPKNYRLQETTIQVQCERGTMKVNEDYLKMVSNTDEKNLQNETVYYRQSLASGVVVDIGGAEYTREDLDFVKCVQNNTAPALNLFECSKTQAVIDSIYRSAKTKAKEKVSYIA